MATLTKEVECKGRSDKYTYKCVVTENSYNVANNTSYVTITFSIKGPWSTAAYQDYETYCGILIDGNVVHRGTVYNDVGGSYVTLLTWSGDITHNADGVKNIAVGVYLNNNGSANYLPTQTTSSNPILMGSVALTTIPRASSFGTISGNTIGSNMTVNISRHSTSFTHQLWYKLGNSTWYDLGTGIGTQKTFPISNDLLSQLPTSTSGTLQLCLRTYNGNVQIGSDVYKSVTVFVASSVVPTVGTITLTPQTYNYLLQNKNTVKITVSGCSAGAGSSIKSYTFSGPGVSTTITSTSATSSTISNTGELTYTVKVTDNRGRTTTSNPQTITCYAYVAPSFSSFSAYRCNSDGTANEKGTYINCAYTLSYSSVNNTNDVTVKIYHKKNSEMSWRTPVAALTDSKNTSNSNRLSGIETSATYSVYATITDHYGGSNSSEILTISSERRILNITADGTGVAIGKVSEKTSSHTNGLFECALDTQLYNDLNVDGDITVDGTVKIAGSLTIGSKTLLDLLHPVGSIYQSTVSTSPATLFGGTWEQLSGRFLIAANSTYAAGSTGGEETHTLTTAEMPGHQGHMYDNFNDSGYVNRDGDENSYYVNSSAAGYSQYDNRPYKIVSGNEFVMQGYTRGSNQPHNNMPPYLAVYMWKRTK